MRRSGRVARTYGNWTGRRFAVVEFADGDRVDVLVRGPDDGSAMNAFGSAHPFFESRTQRIIGAALAHYYVEAK
jgi:hypothetical protein